MREALYIGMVNRRFTGPTCDAAEEEEALPGYPVCREESVACPHGIHFVQATDQQYAIAYLQMYMCCCSYAGRKQEEEGCFNLRFYS